MHARSKSRRLPCIRMRSADAGHPGWTGTRSLAPRCTCCYSRPSPACCRHRRAPQAPQSRRHSLRCSCNRPHGILGCMCTREDSVQEQPPTGCSGSWCTWHWDDRDSKALTMSHTHLAPSTQPPRPHLAPLSSCGRDMTSTTCVHCHLATSRVDRARSCRGAVHHCSFPVRMDHTASGPDKFLTRPPRNTRQGCPSSISEQQH